MALPRPTKLDLMEYALEGVFTKIGTHPAPVEDPEYIEQLVADRDWIKKRIEVLKAKTYPDSNLSR